MIPVRKINIDRLKKFVNLKNFINLKNGLEKTIKWYKKNNQDFFLSLTVIKLEKNSFITDSIIKA